MANQIPNEFTGLTKADNEYINQHTEVVGGGIIIEKKAYDMVVDSMCYTNPRTGCGQGTMVRVILAITCAIFAIIGIAGNINCDSKTTSCGFISLPVGIIAAILFFCCAGAAIVPCILARK